MNKQEKSYTKKLRKTKHPEINSCLWTKRQKRQEYIM